VAALTPICEVGKNAFARQDLHQKGSGTPIHRPSLWQQHIASTSGLTEARPYVVVSVAKVFLAPLAILFFTTGREADEAANSSCYH
jgi:hypothetical protein